MVIFLTVLYDCNLKIMCVQSKMQIGFDFSHSYDKDKAVLETIYNILDKFIYTTVLEKKN